MPTDAATTPRATPKGTISLCERFAARPGLRQYANFAFPLAERQRHAAQGVRHSISALTTRCQDASLKRENRGFAKNRAAHSHVLLNTIPEAPARLFTFGTRKVATALTNPGIQFCKNATIVCVWSRRFSWERSRDPRESRFCQNRVAHPAQERRRLGERHARTQPGAALSMKMQSRCGWISAVIGPRHINVSLPRDPRFQPVSQRIPRDRAAVDDHRVDPEAPLVVSWLKSSGRAHGGHGDPMNFLERVEQARGIETGGRKPLDHVAHPHRPQHQGRHGAVPSPSRSGCPHQAANLSRIRIIRHPKDEINARPARSAALECEVSGMRLTSKQDTRE